MKNAKKIGIAIVQVVIAGILVFVAVKIGSGDKKNDVDVGQVTVEQVEETPVPSETATPETQTSEANADGYGEETLTQTEDGSYLDGEASTSDDENDLTDEETSEQLEATATPAPVATATPQPVQATPQPTAVPQPAATTPPQQTVNQPEQSSDDGAVPDWFDQNDTGYSDDDFAGVEGWGDTVLE